MVWEVKKKQLVCVSDNLLMKEISTSDPRNNIISVVDVGVTVEVSTDFS
jgi:hypothetical protein